MAELIVTTLADEIDPDATVESPGGSGLSLREALALANASEDADEIVFHADLAGQTIALADVLTIASSVSIDGDFDDDGTPDITIDAGGATRVLDVIAGTSSITGLALTGGNGATLGLGSGGVLILAGATLSIAHSALSDHAGTYGGAINNEGTLAITDTAIRDNEALGGAAIFNKGDLSLTNVTIAGNTAAAGGGGILLQEGTLTLHNSTLSGNVAGDNGGGLRTVGGSSATLTNVTIHGNAAHGAYGGGGIYAAGALALTGVTVTGNHGAATAGGVYVASGHATIADSILVGNDAAGDLNVSGAATSALAGVNVLGESNVGRDGTDISGASAADVFATVVTIDPDGLADSGDEFEAGALAGNGGAVETVAIRRGGAAQDSGADAASMHDHDGNPATPEVPLATDARGEARVAGGRVDAGAFELQRHDGALIVSTTEDQASDGGSLAQEMADGGGLSLREALALANETAQHDLILFAESLAGQTIFLDGVLTIASDVTINGDIDGDGDADIAIDGRGEVRAFDVLAGTASIHGLAITNGYSFGGGAVLVAAGATLSLSASVVSGNEGIYSGAINNAGTLTIADTGIHFNSGIHGGGIFNTGDLTLTNVTVSNNLAQGGGGILNQAGTLTVRNSTIAANYATDSGGGVRVVGGSTADLVNVTIHGNAAGGIYGGGGIYSAGTLALTNVTITGNRAEEAGGGLYVGAGETTIANSIVVGNGASSDADARFFGAAEPPTLAGVNVLGDTTIGRPGIDVTGAQAVDVFQEVTGEDPDETPGSGDEFTAGALAYNGGPVATVAIKAGGLAHDTGGDAAAVYDHDGDPGTADVPLPTDARGFDRSAGAHVDVGAMELHEGASYIVTTLEDEGYDGGSLAEELADGGGLSLREALELSNADPSSTDLITFLESLAGRTLTLTRGELAIYGNVTIDGDVTGSAGPDIAIDAGGESAVVHVYRGTATLNGLTITGGDALYGAGVSVGAALFGLSADVTISNTVIRDNVAVLGGGISVDTGSALQLVNSTVADNEGGIGAGIAVQAGAALTLVNTTVSGNQAYGPGSAGGGIAINTGATVALLNSTIAGNSAALGGGIYNIGHLTLTNTTLANNAATYGGGLYNAAPYCGCGGEATLISSTVSGNFAEWGGGGIYHAAGYLTLVNSIVAGNGGYAPDLLASGPVLYAGVNVFSQAGIGNPDSDIYEPDLADIFETVTTITPAAGEAFEAGLLAQNGGPVETIAIAQDGAAYNSGDEGALPQDGFDADADGETDESLPVDARGAARVSAGGLDVGAYEWQNTPPSAELNAGLTLAEGDTAAITASLLAFGDAEQGNGSIVYTITSEPGGGTLLLDDVALAAGDTFTQDDIDNGRLSYAHGGDEAPDDAFGFSVSDGAGGTVTGQSFAISVAPVNDAPTARTNAGLALSEGDGATITANLLYFDDPEQGGEAIVYTITGAPSAGTLLLDGSALDTGDSFTQEDIVAGRLRYQHDGSETAGDAFGFSVSDGAGGLVAGQSFAISVEPMNDAPSPSHNAGLTLARGGLAPITASLLDFDDPEQDDGSLMYTVTAGPAAGTLLLNGDTLGVGGTFTQDDLNHGRLSYAHGGGAAASDAFGFSVDDGAGGLVPGQSFAFTITEPNDPPVQGANTGLSLDEGASATVTATQLDYNDAQEPPENVTYTITTAVAVGTLLLNGSAFGLGGSFTQDDIDNGRLRYAHDGSETTTASFGFQVSDGVNPAVTGQSFAININAVNDAPVNMVPGTQILEANHSLAITGLAIKDADAFGGGISTVLSVGHGTLAVAALGGASVTGSGTASVTISGTLAAVNATLGGVVYTPATDWFDDDTLTMATSDGGNTGIGGPLGDTDTFAIDLHLHLFGTPEADAFDVPAGNARIDALGGTDTIMFDFKLTEASVRHVGNTVIIDGPSSHTVLTGFERFVFTDGTVVNDDGNPLVDDLFYYSRNHDVWTAGASADEHFETFGWRESRDPSAFFSIPTYLSAYPDVAAAGGNPLTHFHAIGWIEGRVPSIRFDTQQYLADNPDVAASHADPLDHYLRFGYDEGRMPPAPGELIAANGFDYVWYLNHNADVAAARIDPFQHFMTVGWTEGRNPNAVFDVTGYLAHYADVAAAQINPLTHYDQFGWQEGRDPSAGFDTSAYLGAYADVAAADTNPLTHFLQFGIHEGRDPHADGAWG